VHKYLFSFLALCAFSSHALSQDTTQANAALPVEATADDLQVSSDTNSAIFSGNAKVVQGILDLRADKITVFFQDDVRNIRTVKALGQVKFTNGEEIAEAQSAQFDVASQVITFSNNVILRQTQTVLTGDKLTYNIKTNRSQMAGNVKTIFTPK
jgi:lipopolysaccharide export system protein LptA